MSKKLNLIFDIDDTLVAYTRNADWAAVPVEVKKQFRVFKNPTGVFVLRPHFDEMMKFAFENCATVNLWTWSDMEYAQGLAKHISDCNPAWKFANIWAEEDADASMEYGAAKYPDKKGHAKDLNYIWYEKKKFNPCDTILVDDRDGNVLNPSNRRNTIHVKMFHPDAEGAKDDVFVKVIAKLKEVMAQPGFCSEGDLPFPLPAPYRATARRRTRKAKKAGRRRKTVKA